MSPPKYEDSSKRHERTYGAISSCAATQVNRLLNYEKGTELMWSKIRTRGVRQFKCTFGCGMHVHLSKIDCASVDFISILMR